MLVDFPHTEYINKDDKSAGGPQAGDEKSNYNKFMAFNANLMFE